MKHSERLLRNKIVINLSKKKMSVSSIGETVGLKKSQVNLILHWGRENNVLSMPSLGRPALLDAGQLLQLGVLLAKGATSYEFTGDYWTHKRVKYVIEKEFGVIYEEKQVGRILVKIGWSRQKPQKKEAKQDSAKVESWKSEGLPALKKKP